MAKNILKNLIAFGTGISVLLYLLATIGFKEIYNLLMGIRLEYFILAAFAYFITDVISSFAVREGIDSKINVLKILPAHMCGMFYSAVTPGRVGYYYTAFSLSKKTQDSRSGNIGILTVIQGIYFFTKVFLCILALVYFSRFLLNPESMNYLIIASILPIVFVIGIVLIIYTNLPNRILSKFPIFHKFLKYVDTMQNSCRRISKKELLKITVLGFIGWITMSIQWLFIAMSLNSNISVIDALMLQPLLTTIMFIPFSPSGLGFTEGGSEFLFGLITPDLVGVGVTFMLLIRLNSILVDSFGLIDMRIHGNSK